MKPSIDLDPALERLLVGAPARVVDAASNADATSRAEFDTSRNALCMLAFALPPSAPSQTLRERIADALTRTRRPTRRALIVLDMLVDHLTPERPLEIPRARAIVPALRERIERARAAGEPVIYACDRHEPDDPELHAWSTHAVAGTPGAEVVAELAPREGDRIVPHRTYSAFFESALDDTLRELAIDSIVLTGCITELGLFVTASDAMMRGYAVEVPADSQAGSSVLTERVTLSTLSMMTPVRNAEVR